MFKAHDDDYRDHDCRKDVSARRRAGGRVAAHSSDRQPARTQGHLEIGERRSGDLLAGIRGAASAIHAGQSFGWIPFAEPVLCIKAIGGPFEFDIDIMPMEDGE
jgi:hypothetical protein